MGLCSTLYYAHALALKRCRLCTVKFVPYGRTHKQEIYVHAYGGCSAIKKKVVGVSLKFPTGSRTCLVSKVQEQVKSVVIFLLLKAVP